MIRPPRRKPYRGGVSKQARRQYRARLERRLRLGAFMRLTHANLGAAADYSTILTGAASQRTDTPEERALWVVRAATSLYLRLSQRLAGLPVDPMPGLPGDPVIHPGEIVLPVRGRTRLK